jgi:hypothetical protein
MKKVIFTLCCIFLINSINCFSQSIEKNKNEFKSETGYVNGYSERSSDVFRMGITFGKVLSLIDTNYYIEFDLEIPGSEYRTDICLNKAKSLTFLTRNGRSVDLKMTDVSSSIKSDKQTVDPFTPIEVNYHSTTLILEVTKEELMIIGSEPFYRLLLPYFNCSSKAYNEVRFVKPTLFTRRVFIQKNINYILDN